MKTIPASVKSYLHSQNIRHEVVPHKTVFTAYDLGQTLRVKLDEIVKTLLVKADRQYHLIVLRASDRLDLKKLQKLLQAKSLKIAREQDMVRELNVKPGAITPFGTLHKLSVVMDRALLKAKVAFFGSGSFEHAVRMSVADFVKHERPMVGHFSVSAGLKLQTKPTTPKPRSVKTKKSPIKRRR